MSELNQQKVRLFVEAVLNERRLELIDELVSADYVGQVPCAQREVLGRDALRELVIEHRLAHPDLYIKIENEIAEDDLVVMRWRSAARTRATTDGPSRCWGISVVRLLAGRQVDTCTAVGPSATNVTA